MVIEDQSKVAVKHQSSSKTNEVWSEISEGPITIDFVAAVPVNGKVS